MIDVKKLAEKACFVIEGDTYRSMGDSALHKEDLEAYTDSVIEEVALLFNQPHVEYFGQEIQEFIRAMKIAKEQK